MEKLANKTTSGSVANAQAAAKPVVKATTGARTAKDVAAAAQRDTMIMHGLVASASFVAKLGT